MGDWVCVQLLSVFCSLYSPGYVWLDSVYPSLFLFDWFLFDCFSFGVQHLSIDAVKLVVFVVERIYVGVQCLV